MKKFVFILISLMMIIPGNLSAEGTQENCCETINQIMDDSAKEYREMSQTIMKEYLKAPEGIDIENCLAAINSINVGFSFSLPSLDELLQMACDFAKSQIESRLQEASSQVANQYSFGAYGVEAGGDIGVGSDDQSNVDFEVNDTSGEIVDSIWRSIQ